jgi:CO/xanthine dehydrogenase Mo-binding subunit
LKAANIKATFAGSGDAIYPATEKRVRDLPITMDKLQR